jgi:hypothetical protein
MKEQVKQALTILQQVVDASTGAGVFKKASEVALIVQAFIIITNEVTSIEKQPENDMNMNDLKKVKK